MNSLKRLMRWTVSLALLVGCAAGVLAWQGMLPVAKGKTSTTAKAPAKPEKPEKLATDCIAVTVAEVIPRTVQRRVQVVGTLYGFEEVELASKVDGRIARILHDVGDIVRPGEVLLEVDDTDLKLLVNESARSLELEMAKLGLRSSPSPDFDLHKLPSVARAELLEKNARNKLERGQALFRRQALSKEDLEQHQTDFEVAHANSAQALLEAEASLATIRQREALLETARQKLRDARVVVPVPSAGLAKQTQRPVVLTSARQGASAVGGTEYVVAERLVSEGEMVHASPSTSVFRLVIDQPLKLKATVPERYAGDVEVGQPVELAVEAYPGEVFHGVVSRVNPTVDRANRTFAIEVRVANDDRRLRAGSFAKAGVLTREQHDVPTVPEESLVKFAGVVKVFVVRDGKSHAVPVESGTRLEVAGKRRSENWLETIGDLQPGDEVVTTGHSQLAEGTPVRVRRPETAAAQADD